MTEQPVSLVFKVINKIYEGGFGCGGEASSLGVDSTRGVDDTSGVGSSRGDSKHGGVMHLRSEAGKR